MATRNAADSTDALAWVPDWWAEPVLGVAAMLAGVGGIAAGSTAVQYVAGRLFQPASGTYPFWADTHLQFLVVLVPTLAVHAAVGAGVTKRYLDRRDLDPGFVVEAPDGVAARWLAGLVALTPVALWTGALLGWLLPVGSSGIAGMAYVASGPVPLPGMVEQTLPYMLSLWASTVLVVGPVAGLLVHGVVQPSLRRVLPVEGTAVGVGLVAGVAALAAGGNGPVGALAVAAFAAAVAYGYDRSENLAVPLVAYAAFNAVVAATALLASVTSGFYL